MELNKRLSSDELRMELDGITEVFDMVVDEMSRDIEETGDGPACADKSFLYHRVSKTYYPILTKLCHDMVVLRERVKGGG